VLPNILRATKHRSSYAAVAVLLLTGASGCRSMRSTQSLTGAVAGGLIAKAVGADSNTVIAAAAVGAYGNSQMYEYAQERKHLLREDDVYRRAEKENAQILMRNWVETVQNPPKPEHLTETKWQAVGGRIPYETYEVTVNDVVYAPELQYYER